MGSSCSDEEKPSRRQLKPAVNDYLKSVNHYNRSQLQTERVQKLHKWRPVLTEILLAEDVHTVNGWDTIKHALIQYINELPDENNIKWIINAQFTTLTSPSYFSQFMAREDNSVLDIDKMEKSGPVFYARKHWSEIEQTDLSISDGDILGKSVNLRVAPKHFARSQIFRSFQSKISAKEELKRNLFGQITTSHHIVMGLMHVFVPLCENLMLSSSQDISFGDNSGQDEVLYQQVIQNIRLFVSKLKKFVNWIYEDLLLHLENGLDQEDLTTSYVVESVLYDILFRKIHSNLYNLLYKNLSLKYHNFVEKLGNIMLEKREDPLESYDVVIKGAPRFLLKNSARPYKRVSRKIVSVQLEMNPYAKFDILASMNDEIWDTIREYYGYDELVLKKLKESFGADLRIPILIYSIVQSQYQNIIVDLKFVEEFICPGIKSSSFGYLTFESSLDFLLNGNAQDSNEEIEIQGLEEI